MKNILWAFKWYVSEGLHLIKLSNVKNNNFNSNYLNPDFKFEKSEISSSWILKRMSDGDVLNTAIINIIFIIFFKKLQIRIYLYKMK